MNNDRNSFYVLIASLTGTLICLPAVWYFTAAPSDLFNQRVMLNLIDVDSLALLHASAVNIFFQKLRRRRCLSTRHFLANGIAPD